MNETEIGSMLVRLMGDGTQYQSMLKTAEQSTQDVAQHIQTATKHIEDLAGGLKTFASSAMSVLGMLGVASSLKGAFDSYAGLERGTLRLTAAIEGQGRATGPVIADYLKFAKSIAAVTLTTKGAVMGMFQRTIAMGLGDDAAKAAIKNSIALASVNGGEASSYLRGAIALQQGNPHLLARRLGILGIKDASVLMAKVQEALISGWKTAEAEAGSASGQIEKLGRAFKGLSREVGKLVAEAIKPVVQWLTQAVDWFNNLDPSIKKVAVSVVAGLGVFLLLGPTLRMIGTVISTIAGPFLSIAGIIMRVGMVLFSLLSPIALVTTLWTGLTAVLGFVVSVVSGVVGVIGSIISFIGFLLTPIGLVSIALVALTAAIIYWGATSVNWSEKGSQVLGWFAEKWQDLKKHVQPAIDGITNAIKAGQIRLAFDILWLQIQVSFATAIQPLREMWVGFVLLVEEVWINATSRIQSTWDKTTSAIAKGLIYLGDALEMYGEAEKQARLKQIDEMGKEVSRATDSQRKASLAAAQKDAQDAMRGLSDNLKALQKERDNLVTQAAEAAAKIKTDKKTDKIVDPVAESFSKATREIHGFHAALTGSAEALERYQKYRDMLDEIIKPAGATTQSTSSVPQVTYEVAAKEVSDYVGDVLKYKSGTTIVDPATGESIIKGSINPATGEIPEEPVTLQTLKDILKALLDLPAHMPATVFDPADF